MHHEAPREHVRPASAAKAQAGAGPHKVSLKQATVQAERRFPPPWEVHEATESFCIRDNDLAVASHFELLIAFIGNKPIGWRPTPPTPTARLETEYEATTTSEPRVPNAARVPFCRVLVKQKNELLVQRRRRRARREPKHQLL